MLSGYPRSAPGNGFRRDCGYDVLFRHRQCQRFSRRSDGRRHVRRKDVSSSCRRWNDGRKVRIDHDPLGPFMQGTKPDDGSIDVGASRRHGELRQIPVRQEQKRQQHAPHGAEVPTKGHVHIPLLPYSPKLGIQRELVAIVPWRMSCCRRDSCREKVVMALLHHLAVLRGGRECLVRRSRILHFRGPGACIC